MGESKVRKFDRTVRRTRMIGQQGSKMLLRWKPFRQQETLEVIALEEFGEPNGDSWGYRLSYADNPEGFTIAGRSVQKIDGYFVISDLIRVEGVSATREEADRRAYQSLIDTFSKNRLDPSKYVLEDRTKYAKKE